jgi:hypothetical protein
MLTVLQEYLSKPLKQNLLIQTILKCTALGGALLERSNEALASATDEGSTTAPPPPAMRAKGKKDLGLLRPSLENRALTATASVIQGSAASPTEASARHMNPMEAVSL